MERREPHGRDHYDLVKTIDEWLKILSPLYNMDAINAYMNFTIIRLHGGTIDSR